MRVRRAAEIHILVNLHAGLDQRFRDVVDLEEIDRTGDADLIRLSRAARPSVEEARFQAPGAV